MHPTVANNSNKSPKHSPLNQAAQPLSSNYKLNESKQDSNTRVDVQDKRQSIFCSKDTLNNAHLYKKLLYYTKDRSNLCKERRFQQNSEDICKKLQFKRHNFLGIFFKDIKSSEIEYVATAGQNSNFEQFFQYLREQLTYLQRMTAKPQKLVKIRTTILRRVMDEYCQSLNQGTSSESDQVLMIGRKMKKEDEAKYEKAQLPVPLSRMQGEFINRLFMHRPFRQYYLSYVKSDRLWKYLITASRLCADSFRLQVHTLLTKPNGLRAAIDLYQHPGKAPLFYRQIKIHLKQARLIANKLASTDNFPVRKLLPKKEKETVNHQPEDDKMNDYVREFYPELEAELGGQREKEGIRKAFERLRRKS